jgi:cysteine-rich repeat protein
MRVAFALLLAAAGCNSILGIGDVHAPAGATDAQPDTTDAPASGPLAGTSVVTYVKADATTTVKNEDLTTYTIGAYIPDGSPEGFHHVAGTGTADGTFTVPDVPDGEILLELTRPNAVGAQLYAVRARAIDAGWVTLGRPDGVPTTLLTSITLNLTGMTSWSDGDQLWADSYATGTENALVYGVTNPSLTNPPAPGATTLATAFDWKTGYTYDASGAPPRLVQASAGDDFYVTHVTTVAGPDAEGDVVAFSSISDLFHGSGVDMTDGGTATVSGAFTKVAADQTQQLTLELPQYRSLAHDGGNLLSESYDCYRLANYAIAYDGRIGAPVWDVQGTPVATTVGVTISGTYGDPFPASWSSLFNCEYKRLRAYALPGGQRVFWISRQAFDIPATSNMDVSPRLGAPANATIDGKPFLTGGAIPFDGIAPVVVQWSAVPTASFYVVTVLHDYANGTRGAAQVAGTITTSDTRVTIPAALLQKGEFYNLRLAAFYTPTPTAFAGGSIRKFGFPSGSSDVVSGLYLFSSDCGNGAVDPGEECDTSGESATCDADCSVPACGDGLVNMAAGEACDNSGESETCENDCKLPQCGDGVVNSTAGEACDDGNTAASDGCSATCKVESGWTCDQSAPSKCMMTAARLGRRGQRPAVSPQAGPRRIPARSGRTASFGDEAGARLKHHRCRAHSHRSWRGRNLRCPPR